MDIRPASPNLAHDVTASLRGVGILDLLECDTRPTFILDTTVKNRSRDNATVPVYWNPAMASLDLGRPLNALMGKGLPDDSTAEACVAFVQFQSWILNVLKIKGRAFPFHGLNWTEALLANRWSVISGTIIDTSMASQSTHLDTVKLVKQISRTKVPSFDWTDEVPPRNMSGHIAWARNIDWSRTPLGPMSSWSAQIKSNANLIMQDPRPAVGFYGLELVMIYNEPYIELLGGLHPCMGLSARIALAGVWSMYFEPIIARNLAGDTVEQINTAIHLVRNGFMEETYFSLKFIPIFDNEGATVGHYEPLAETTREVIAQRQSQTVLALSEEIPRARDTTSYWIRATEVLSRNGKDIPFALLYSIEDISGDSASSTTRFSENNQECTLRGSIGLPKDGSLVAPTSLDFRQDRSWAPYFLEAMNARKPITVQFDQGSPAAELVRGVMWQGFGDPCRAAAICPLNPTSSKDNILGFIVVGLNPRRPYDDDYNQFILVASRLLSTSLTSILLHEEDIGRRERTIANAEAMKNELRIQLQATQKEVERSMLKFQRFAERADIAIFIINMDGSYSYRNEAWYNMFGPNELDLDAGWNALVDDSYIPGGQAKFEQLIETGQHQSFELRLKKTWNAPSHSLDESIPEEQPMWVLSSIFPEVSEEGEVLEIIGCCTDISQQKWAEKLQATQASNAKESKRQLENFIDTTSHEMRNPLSAIVQCADSIISTHKAFGSSTDYQKIYQSILETTIDAAETIVQCSKHMKTIVDDVLTMSKLDSGLFVVTPVDVELESIARDAVKMFEGEARSAGVDLEFQLEESCKQTNIENVSLDPTRVLQILINLITNAIKFTRLEETRHIAVSLGISLERPTHNAGGYVPFLRTSEEKEAPSLLTDWEKGEHVYVIFSVQDTGRGLSASEHELLFARFSQSSPRTHIDYGGSGLGLFISRRLTEMHGGAIGFASTPGVGSTFSFYIKSRKTTPSLTRRPSHPALDLNLRAQASALSNRSRDETDEPPPLARKLTEDGVAASELHILVVEDNLVNQRVLAKQLRKLGMHVAVANHGGEALEYLRSTNYHTPSPPSSTSTPTPASPNSLSLILMDWEMPVMDGLTCVRNIRELQLQGVVRGHVPVIAVTANVRSEQVEVALEAGMDDVISKPFRIPELCACIQKTLRSTSGNG